MMTIKLRKTRQVVRVLPRTKFSDYPAGYSLCIIPCEVTRKGHLAHAQVVKDSNLIFEK
jgi:hypothetical protein